MNDSVFIDTNIFVYARTEDDAFKHGKAKQLLGVTLEGKEVTISTQVLSEFYSGMTKHHRPHGEIRAFLYEIIDSANVVTLSLPTIESCLLLKEKYHYSWWDSLILASALESNCVTVYSEDMQDGQLLTGSQIDFLEARGDRLAVHEGNVLH
ncbi:twitching motility protein PilT [Spirochaetia bacterium]|nr:twitching motility protein PilT [Spirochaetia bacterium]